MKKEIKKQPIIINLIGGPGTGKSILTAELFAKLKRNYNTCEISSEYIKRKLREQAIKVVQNQIYIFAKQQFQLFSMRDEEQLDVVVTDSPFILCPIYDKTKCKWLKGLAIKEFKKYRNLTYFIERDASVKYEQDGRYQDLAGAKLVDKKIKKFLTTNKIKFKSINGIGQESMDIIIKDVTKELNKNGKTKTHQD